MKIHRYLFILLLFIVAVAVVYYLDAMPFGDSEHEDLHWIADWENLRIVVRISMLAWWLTVRFRLQSATE